MTSQNILISGAGIAGPVLAHWLARAGHRATVVERAPAPRPGGQAVDLRGAGRTVVDRMGLLGRARDVAVDQAGMAYVREDGSRAATIDVDAFGGEGVVSEIEILRGDLAEVFYDATVADVEYVFDDTITSLDQDEHGVDVGFERSAGRRFDLVVGADGVHSVTRRLGFDAPDAEHPIGLSTAWFTAPAELELGGWYLMYNAVGGRVAGVRPGRLAGEHKVSLSFRSEPLSFDRRDLDAQRRIVAEHFEGAGWETPRLVAAMWSAPDLVLDSAAQVRMASWSAGRIVLLGDAGYCPSPLTGLGTSLALVGAYVLAGELSVADGNHQVAFAAYQERLRDYVRTAHELPPMGVDGYAPRTRAMIALRNVSTRWMTRPPLRGMIARQFAKAGDIELPDYAADATKATVAGS